jgi:hypothetical protein
MVNFLNSGVGLLLLGILFAIFGFLLKFLWNKILETERELAAYKLHVAENYVRKKEIDFVVSQIANIDKHVQQRIDELSKLFIQQKRGEL